MPCLKLKNGHESIMNSAYINANWRRAEINREVKSSSNFIVKQYVEKRKFAEEHKSFKTMDLSKIFEEPSKGKQYLQDIAKRHADDLEMKDEVMSGMPVVKGSRIPAALILACFRDEMTIEQICEDYILDSTQVKASLNYSIDILNYPFLEE